MFRLISIDELKQLVSIRVDNIIIDARRTKAYAAGHIPGALHMLWEDWCEAPPFGASETLHQAGWWGRLEDLEVSKLEKKLGECGLCSESHIIVYADGLKAKGRDGRIAWMLLYFGAKNVSILNGGWNGWVREQCEIQVDCELPVEKKFVVNFDEASRMQLRDLRKRNDVVGVDTRSLAEHQGVIYDYQPRLGRIPNSLNIPFSSLYEEDEKFLDADAFVRKLRTNQIDFEAKSNLLDYSYCEVGVRATTFSLLYELYTGLKLPVYDGSFMEWAYDPDLAVERD